MNDNIKHAAIIPLIGGFSIAATNVLNKLPEAIFSYDAFYNNDSLYLNYLNKHNKTVPYFQLNKENLNKSDIERYKGYFDLVHGVPPCAGLSMSGNLKKGARSTSPVNDWMLNATDFVLGELQPKVYVFENAPTLFTGVGDLVRAQLIEKAEKFGYGVTFYKTDTQFHGIPQRRPRTYIIFAKGKNAPLLEYTRKEMPSIEDYLKLIPEDATLQDKYTSKEESVKDFEIVKFIKQKYGEDWRKPMLEMKDHITSYDFLNRADLLGEYKDYLYSLPEEEVHENSKRDLEHVIKKLSMGKNYRLSHRVLCVDKKHIYAVVGEMMIRNVHPTEDRRMNIREYLHFMGMPHDFEVLNPKDYGKIPQNCPVTTNEFIINEAVNIIKGNRKFSAHIYEMQNNIKYEETKSKQLF